MPWSLSARVTKKGFSATDAGANATGTGGAQRTPQQPQSPPQSSSTSTGLTKEDGLRNAWWKSSASLNQAVKTAKYRALPKKSVTGPVSGMNPAVYAALTAGSGTALLGMSIVVPDLDPLLPLHENPPPPSASLAPRAPAGKQRAAPGRAAKPGTAAAPVAPRGRSSGSPATSRSPPRKVSPSKPSATSKA